MAKNITLDNFESRINSSIVSRGKRYYKNGQIDELESESPGHWETTVQGSDTYGVVIDLDGNTLQEHVCTCPYAEDGEICKHIVAVLFELREKLVDSTTRKPVQLSKAEILAMAREARLEKARKIIEGTQPQTEIEKAPEISINIVDSDPSVSKGYQKWANLPETLQKVVKILALWGDKYSRDQVAAVYKQVYNADASKMGDWLKMTIEAGLVKKSGSEFKCDPEFGEYLCRETYSSDDRFPVLIFALNANNSNRYWSYSYYPENTLREVRFALYQKDVAKFKKSFLALNDTGTPVSKMALIERWLPDTEYGHQNIDQIPREMGLLMLYYKLYWQLPKLTAPDFYFNYALDHIEKGKNEIHEGLTLVAATTFLLRDDREGLKRTLLLMEENHNQQAFAGIIAFLKGDKDQAGIAFEAAAKSYRKYAHSTKAPLEGIGGLFFLFYLLQQQKAENATKIENILKKNMTNNGVFQRSFEYANNVHLALSGLKTAAVSSMNYHRALLKGGVGAVFYNICAFIIDEKLTEVDHVKSLAKNCEKNGYLWAARELNTIIAFKKGQPAPESDFNSLTQFFPRVEEWETALKILQDISGTAQGNTFKENDTRLIWLADFEKKILEAKEQTYGKKGWSSGRVVSDSRLTNKDVKSATTQDILVMDAMFSAHNRYYWSKDTENAAVWKALAGHPLLFLYKSPTVAVQLTEEKPVLIARQTDAGYEMRFEPEIQDEGAMIVKETPTRYKLFSIDPEHLRIASAFGGRTLLVPEKGLERFNETVGKLAHIVSVQSSLDINDGTIQEVASDARPCVHLLPVGDGFHIELYVKPFATNPPYFKPGKGETSVIALLDGQRVRTIRDLKKEEKELKKLKSEVAFLSENKPKDHIWEVEDANTCLEVLTDLHPLLHEGSITLEWPKGEKFKVTTVAGIDQFRMSIKKQNNWFEVSGELRIDEDRVLNIQELIALSERQKSGFIELSPGKFLALTAEFRKRLREVNGLMNATKQGTMQLHPLAITAFQSLSDAVQHTELDKAFVENKAKIQSAFSQKFKLPKNFNAELRAYQQEGFEWLHKLAAWGVGACLADDMGLGKTVQALAFLTDRASQGPALVIAPVSVCRNWVKEVEKFTPALTAHLFGDGERESMIKNAGKGDLVIATYDLLTRESQHFIDKKWSTVILDEAQAIKNRTTKRSETAMQLQADFRLIMSGTPVENHLGELWNLFQFANPGLLGSIDQFNERFALPIEKNKDDDRRDQLRRLVQPFILRRRKDEVLKELPAKTEIVLQVELTPDERAFYEALRRKAIATIESEKDEMGGGEQHLRILAEIMKLRRAACHPKLADKDVAGFLESSKQRLFGEVVNELIENGHRALVFSQFVSHLAILEEHLKKQNISYQYLDGQTPSAQRQKRIDAFQQGEGDLFLISLKAGGTGLNLTAADYVIHMDPWWNPAVEDQATDRAHRIGQEKPVTVYRLVATGTIEEKILQLHEQKRDLADSLLSGTGASAKLTADELMKLLKER